MQRALAVARQAHAALLFAYDFENVLCDPIRFNYLCWSAWTGEYGEEGRGGPSPAREAESPASSAIDDGGWSVDDCKCLLACLRIVAEMPSRHKRETTLVE